MTNWWTIGYAPFNRVPGAGIFTRKVDAEQEARRLNSDKASEYRGRGLKAVKCDANGRLVR